MVGARKAQGSQRVTWYWVVGGVGVGDGGGVVDEIDGGGAVVQDTTLTTSYS